MGEGEAMAMQEAVEALVGIGKGRGGPLPPSVISIPTLPLPPSFRCNKCIEYLPTQKENKI